MAARCSGCRAAVCHWFSAKYEMPLRPTLPLDHGCTPAQSTQMARSWASRSDQMSMTPSEVPVEGIAVLEVQLLAVRAEGHDHRIPALDGGPVDVGTQRDAVVHDDRHV